MPSRDYGDLSRLALEADLDVDELRARQTREDERQRTARIRTRRGLDVHAYANLWKPPRKPFVLQLEAARAEWRRRHEPRFRLLIRTLLLTKDSIP